VLQRFYAYGTASLGPCKVDKRSRAGPQGQVTVIFHTNTAILRTEIYTCYECRKSYATL